MTFTILARSSASGLIAAATASYSLAVGNAVPAVIPGVGAVASQAYTNRSLRHRMLDELGSGATPETSIAAMSSIDPDIECRQLAALNFAGNGAAHTGNRCSAWAGHYVGEGFVLAGNLLGGEEVLQVMADALSQDGPQEWTPVAFAGFVLDALAAGDKAGGDMRGRQSAAIVVGSDSGGNLYSPDLSVDLRADDSPEPIAELRRLLALVGDVTAQTV